MTYVDKPHTARYTGRGLGWAKKKITKRRANRVARYCAAMIIESTVSDGWAPEHLIDKFGDEGVGMIQNHLLDIALWLRDTTPPDGRE